MSGLTERLRWIVDLDSDTAVRGFEKVGKTADTELKKAESGLSKTSASMTKFGVGALAFAGVAGAALIGFAHQADEAQESQRKLNNTLENSPQLAGETAKAFNDLADAIQKKTGVDGDAVVAGEALLGQFGFTKTQILELTPLVVDLSAKMGVDLDTAFRQVGKTAETGTNGLSKMGIVLDAGALKSDAFGATIDGLRQRVGGFAEQEGKSFTGQLNIMKQEIGDVAEAIGGGVISAFRPLVGTVKDGVDAFKALPQPVQEGVGKFLAFAAAGTAAVGALSFVGGQLIKTIQNVKDFSNWIKNAGTAVTATSVLVVAAGAAYLAYSHDKQEVTKRTEALVEALKQEQAGHKGTVDALIAQRLAQEHLIEKGRELGVSTQDLARLIRGESLPSFQAMKDALSDPNAMGILRRELGASASDIELFVGHVRRLQEDMKRANGEIANSAEVAKVAADAQRALGVVIEPTTEELKAQADAASELEDSTRAALDAQLGFYDSEIRVREAAQNSKEAQDALAQSVKEHGAISLETADALNKLESNVLSEAAAIVDAADKQSLANGVQLTAADRIQANIAALEGLKKKYPELSAQIDVWIAGLQRQKDNAAAAGVAIGGAIPAGINRGISAGIAGSIESIQSMVDAIIAAGKERAGIKSPSRVAADEIGQPMAEGVGVGLEEGQGRAEASSRKVVAGVVKHMDDATLDAFGAGQAVGQAFASGLNAAPTDDLGSFLSFVDQEINRRVQAAKDRMARDKFDSIVDAEVNKRLGEQGVPDKYKTPVPDDPTAKTTTTLPLVVDRSKVQLTGDVFLDGQKVGQVMADSMNVRAA